MLAAYAPGSTAARTRLTGPCSPGSVAASWTRCLLSSVERAGPGVTGVRMELTLLSVPGLPERRAAGAAAAVLLAGRPGVRVSRHVVTRDEEAARRGMHGSPTLLVDGRDPHPASAPQGPTTALRVRAAGGQTAGRRTFPRSRPRMTGRYRPG